MFGHRRAVGRIQALSGMGKSKPQGFPMHETVIRTERKRLANLAFMIACQADSCPGWLRRFKNDMADGKGFGVGG
jgi:hypothetical protein